MGPGIRMKGLIVGLAGCALLGWALFSVFSFAGCSSGAAFAAKAACTDPGASAALAIPAGIILGVVGIFMGGGMVVFGGLFCTVGLAALVPAVLGLMGEMQLFGWLFGGIFFLCGLFPFFGGVLLRKAGAAKQAMAMELMRSGVKGIGTIVAVEDTGVTINDNPCILIRMRIDPMDGSPAVERSKKVIVSRVAIPRAGERFPAWFDRADPDKWMFGTDMQDNASAEVKEMFARAQAGSRSYPLGTGEGGDASAVEELAQLTDLWDRGALTDAEFADAKARLLPRIGR